MSARASTTEDLRFLDLGSKGEPAPSSFLGLDRIERSAHATFSDAEETRHSRLLVGRRPQFLEVHLPAASSTIPPNNLQRMVVVGTGQVFEKCRRSLDEIERTAMDPNWDGDHAAPVTDETLAVARKVAEGLPPLLPAPDVYPNPNGRIEFDWALENETVFTLTVGPERDIAMSARRPQGGRLRGWSRNDQDDLELPLFLGFGLDWLKSMAAK